MCGITGAIWNEPDRALASQTLKRMTDALTHRGPDDEGFFENAYCTNPPYEPTPGVALGARRLAVVDLEGGHQPMVSEDGNIVVVLNGEIYNHADLRRRLEGAGHTFRTRCDTEAVVHLYEDEGLEFAQHLVGMFAVAIWDAPRRQLVLARDRLGQKPLVYTVQKDRLLFASEMKSLLQVPDVDRAIDPSALDEYLTYQYVPHPNTIFRGIRKLPPGHVAVYRDGQVEVQPYWSPNWSQEINRPAADYCQDLRDRLTRSVELRLAADVPLGAFLSGGVDSSLIVALMSQLSGQRVQTFSIGFADAQYDESEHARRVAEHLGTEHHEFRVDPSAVDILPKLVWNFDEPFADSSAIPTWYVAQQTRGFVTVALTGDGGDELFAGYPRYRAVRLGARFDQLPHPFRNLAGSSVWQKLPGARRKSLLRRLKRFTGPVRHDPARRYLEWISIFNEQARAELYEGEFLNQLPNADPYYFLSTAWRASRGRDATAAAAAADLQTYLPCDLMTKVDIASMAHSLECRQPFLDHHVVELALAMPTQLKYRRGRGKRILRDAFGDLLPTSIFQRPKMGFGVPLDSWFRNELKDLAHDVLLDSRTQSRGYFRTATVRRMLEDHVNQRADHSDRLWALLVLEMWHRQWVDVPAMST